MSSFFRINLPEIWKTKMIWSYVYLLYVLWPITAQTHWWTGCCPCSNVFEILKDSQSRRHLGGIHRTGRNGWGVFNFSTSKPKSRFSSYIKVIGIRGNEHKTTCFSAHTVHVKSCSPQFHDTQAHQAEGEISTKMF